MTVPSNQAMPLRIALLAQPAFAAELSADLSPLLASVEKITIGDDFDSALNLAIDAVNQGLLVEFIADPAERLPAGHLVSGAPARIWMLSALTAAKNKVHPHAYLAGMAVVEASDNVNTACETHSIDRALAHAKRSNGDVSQQISTSVVTSEEKFSALLSLIQSISGRTLANGYWFTEPHKARVATLTFMDEASINNASSVSTSLVLTQATGLQPSKSLLSATRLMFVVSGTTQAELIARLTQLNDELVSARNSDHEALTLTTLMHRNLTQFQSQSQPVHSQANIVIQAASLEAALQEINALQQALPKVIADNSHYKTPAGSGFSPAPTSQGGVTFVYPGVGTVYPGMLREFHQYFPSLYARLEREGNLADMLRAEKTYSDDAQEMSLSELAIAGVGSSYLLTQLLCDEFAVKPDFALGYSKGEASMWASLNVWKNPHALIEMTQTSPIFTTAISGKLTAVREDWNLTETDDIRWNSFVVRSDAASIESLLAEFPRAYLAIVQGDTCVLAGCEESCRALLKKLGKRGIAANRVTAMHTTPALSQHQQVREFYTQPLFDVLPQHIRFISAAGNKPVNINSDSIALSIADTFCSTLDFTALIRSAREQGARLFVEVGADRQTSTLIDKINRSDDVANQHCVVATNAKGGEDVVTLLKCLGQLITHQIPLSVAPLIQGLEQQLNALKHSYDLAATDTPANNHQGEPV
ncbi:PfaB family protein [Vibrio sp. ZSDZ65]|uniref:PfaB family protein n=1 Tax=Vibrio qingdaonensis TaxID=2829491 RepID=A0A9X3CLH4_9VIBR|nr:PfaB family protein [Vibrio qingdaonensis]MCW8345648.1 PfaB family protein [Vibrio qingdaonensis]